MWVHTPEKVGRDAGELAGIDPLGVPATDDADALIALAARLRRLRGERSRACERLKAAAQPGGASLYASGSFPGFASDELAVLLTTMSRYIRLRLAEMPLNDHYPVADVTASPNVR